jgi:hypothetical protein
MAVIEKHFRDYRHLYIAGAGDQHFHNLVVDMITGPSNALPIADRTH